MIRQPVRTCDWVLGALLPLLFLLALTACVPPSGPVSKTVYDSGEKIKTTQVALSVRFASEAPLTGEQRRKLIDSAKNGLLRSFSAAGIATKESSAEAGEIEALLSIRLKSATVIHLFMMMVPVPTTRQELIVELSLWKSGTMLFKTSGSSDEAGCRGCDAYLFIEELAGQLGREIASRVQR